MVICNRKLLQAATMDVMLEKLPHMKLISDEGRLWILDIPTTSCETLHLLKQHLELERERAAMQREEDRQLAEKAAPKAGRRLAKQTALAVRDEERQLAQRTVQAVREQTARAVREEERQLATQQIQQLQGQFVKVLILIIMVIILISLIMVGKPTDAKTPGSEEA